MTSQQFLVQIRDGKLAPAYLFVGPEQYQREFCRKALTDRVLPDTSSREDAVSRHDLKQESLASVVDDARSPSLFVADRLIVVSNAEEALPRTTRRSASEDDSGKDSGLEALAAYLSDPAPGVVLLFEATRYDFQGEDKKKLEAVRKFYSAIAAQVEMQPLSGANARQFAQKLASRAGLKIGQRELELLVEALGSDASRISTEIEKLRLYAGDKTITTQDISELIPEARETTIFALVDAIARNDRRKSLELLDTLVRQSEYLPLALSFVSTQFRLALAAKEAGLRSPQQIMGHFSRAGVPMWPSRAEQIAQTLSAFSSEQFTAAMGQIFEADRGLRDTRPDDRVIMEEFILRLTAER